MDVKNVDIKNAIGSDLVNLQSETGSYKNQKVDFCQDFSTGEDNEVRNEKECRHEGTSILKEITSSSPLAVARTYDANNQNPHDRELPAASQCDHVCQDDITNAENDTRNVDVNPSLTVNSEGNLKNVNNLLLSNDATIRNEIMTACDNTIIDKDKKIENQDIVTETNLTKKVIIPKMKLSDNNTKRNDITMKKNNLFLMRNEKNTTNAADSDLYPREIDVRKGASINLTFEASPQAIEVMPTRKIRCASDDRNHLYRSNNLQSWECDVSNLSCDIVCNDEDNYRLDNFNDYHDDEENETSKYAFMESQLYTWKKLVEEHSKYEKSIMKELEEAKLEIEKLKQQGRTTENVTKQFCGKLIQKTIDYDEAMSKISLMEISLRRLNIDGNELLLNDSFED